VDEPGVGGDWFHWAVAVESGAIEPETLGRECLGSGFGVPRKATLYLVYRIEYMGVIYFVRIALIRGVYGRGKAGPERGGPRRPEARESVGSPRGSAM
jgi:hypothetical protein